MNGTLIENKARVMAMHWHTDQKRKYSGVPYITHPIRVAERLEKMGYSPELVAAGYLHDVVEDCGVELSEIRNLFGDSVAIYVDGMTKKTTLADGNRATREKLERDRLTKESHEVKILKLVDRIDNLRDMSGAPSGFMKKYKAESKLLAECLRNASEELYQELISLC